MTLPHQSRFTIRTATPDDWHGIIELTGESFGASPEVFIGQWPHSYYGPEAARHCLVCEQDGRLIGTLNQVPLVLRLGGARLRVTGICGVCTHPDARGQGVMRTMLETSLHQERSHVQAAILWGARERYRRFGFELAGVSSYIMVNRSMLSGWSRTAMRRIEPRDADGLLRLNRRCPDLVERNRIWQERLLACSRVEVYANAPGEISAYLVYAREGLFKGRIIEAAGETEALGGLLDAFLEQQALATVAVWFPPGAEMGRLLALKAENTFQAGLDFTCATHLCILDFPGLLRSLAQPLARNFADYGIIQALRLQCLPDSQIYDICLKEGRLETGKAKASGPADLAFDGPGWVRLLFPSPGAELIEPEIEPTLRRAFGLSLVYPPWDII